MKKVSLRELVADKIIFSILIAIVLLDVGTERLERLLHDRSKRYFCFQLLLFRFPRHPGQKIQAGIPR